MERVIIVDGDEYQLIRNEDGSPCLLRFNPETKMWVKLIFSKERHPEVGEYVITILGKEFVKELVERAAAANL